MRSVSATRLAPLVLASGLLTSLAAHGPAAAQAPSADRYSGGQPAAYVPPLSAPAPYSAPAYPSPTYAAPAAYAPAPAPALRPRLTWAGKSEAPAPVPAAAYPAAQAPAYPAQSYAYRAAPAAYRDARQIPPGALATGPGQPGSAPPSYGQPAYNTSPYAPPAPITSIYGAAPVRPTGSLAQAQLQYSPYANAPQAAQSGAAPLPQAPAASPQFPPPPRPRTAATEEDGRARFYSVHRKYGIQPDPIPLPPQFFGPTADLSTPPGPEVVRRTVTVDGQTRVVNTPAPDQ